MPKKSSTPFTYYTFRYDYDNDQIIEKIKTYIVTNYPKYAIFIEVSQEVQKKHIQGKIGVALSEEQLRKQFKKQFPDVFVKSNYSISSVKEPEKWDSYICKDGKPLCNNIFTQEYIDEQVKIHSEKVIAFKSKEQKKVLNFTQQVLEDFMKEFPLDVNQIRYHYYDVKPSDYIIQRYKESTENLLGYILKRLGKVVKVFDDNILQRMYTGIKNSIITSDDNSSCKLIEQYKNRIVL